jgi:hypothetical protein
LPAFRDLSPEEYREKVKDEVRRIGEEYKEQRGNDSVKGVAKIPVSNWGIPDIRGCARMLT